jgi:hypothetical protein
MPTTIAYGLDIHRLHVGPLLQDYDRVNILVGVDGASTKVAPRSFLVADSDSIESASMIARQY